MLNCLILRTVATVHFPRSCVVFDSVCWYLWMQLLVGWMWIDWVLQVVWIALVLVFWLEPVLAQELLAL